MAHPNWVAFCLQCIPQEVPAQQPKSKQNAQRRIPTLMFHYAFWVVWEPSSRVVIVAGSYKRFPNFAERQNVADDYKQLQSVAKRTFANFSVPTGPRHFLIK